MFRTRLLSGIVLMIIAITFIVAGGYPLFGLITVISVIGLYELYRAVGMEKTVPGIIGYLSGVGLDVLILNTDGGLQPFRRVTYEHVLAWLICTLILLMVCYVICYPKYDSEQMTMLFFGIFYVTLMMSFVFRLRFVEKGVLYVWLIFIGAWGSDTCAYCVGKLIGKHKMPSALSPNKTIEGCAGGVIGAALIGLIFALVLFDSKEYLWKLALICGISAVISQIGDLTASAIKRNHDIKDYGKLIPGHGGILDRFDSIIFIAPIVYYLVVFFHI